MPDDYLADARRTATETYDALAARHSNRARREWLAGEPWVVPEADPETEARVAAGWARLCKPISEILP